VSPRFNPGDRVRVQPWHPPGHVRTPFYVCGLEGEVVAVAGRFPNPEALAYGRSGDPRPLYRVRFRQNEVWPDYDGPAADAVIVDIFEHWLEPAHG